jgi:hypothetical protein
VKSIMKKKSTAEPIVAPEILDLAKKSVESERAPLPKRCAVCRTLCTPLAGPSASDDENLCWVCRRLKISAWREADQQVSAQE